MNRVYAQFCVIFLVSLVLWRTAIEQTFAHALYDNQYTYILPILPITAAFFFLERRSLKPVLTRRSVLASIIFFVAALVIFFIAKKPAIIAAEYQLTLAMIGLVLWWAASFIVCFGLPTFRIFLFPVCFLFWLVPWPQSFLDLLVRLLQHYSASGVSWAFQLFGIPVLQNGVMLSIPGLTIEVARECSSIRSSIFLLLSSMVLAQLFLHSVTRKTIVVLVSVPLSVVKNAVRIFTLSMLGIHVNPGFLTGPLHHRGGIVFYAGALGAVFLLIYWFQRQEAHSPPPKVLEVAAR
jgi:exosortase